MENLKQEEFKHLVSSFEKLDTRYYQLIIFTLTAFGVIFGFSDKIEPNFIVPLMLYVILFFTSTAGARASINQTRIYAYLNKEYFFKEPGIYFSKFYIQDALSNKGVFFKVLDFIKNPFVVFNLFPFILIIQNVYNHIWKYQEIWYYIVLVMIIIFQISILLRVFDMMKKDLNYYFRELDKYLNNNAA